ncbi:transcriptional repressor [Aeromicrobium sp. YIM 150415]|uniref:Transcriptional repressor n=1 Tax=Aeromicrobium piscarium TaxID=2590901 RepID=A0A554SPS6_9ACTN|nr:MULTISPECIES: Fur family transcriptional regulator [Aeromicrobium]MBM9462235.1 transcriptional repressor [Aeromicrobium sp. YIM 150415]TSD68318.1 transcriptional repressor [Aeromicrobium piscarium]
MTATAPITSPPGEYPTPREQLQTAGLRVTTGRLTVLGVVARQPHVPADTVFRSVRETLPGTSVQAVYNVLGDLTRAGLLRRIEPAGSPALYERRVGDNHHHLVCRSCGAVEDVDCAVGEAPCLTPAQSHGFAIDEAEVTFWGLCPTCSAATSTH